MMQFAVFAFAVVGAVAAQAAEAPLKLNGPPKLAFVSAGHLADDPWTQAEGRARLALQKETEAPIPFAEAVTPDAAPAALDHLIADGANVIVGGGDVAASFAAAAKRHPDVAFLDLGGPAAGDDAAPNLQAIVPKTYEGWYLAGIAAGTASKSKMLGIIARRPTPEGLWAVNAFALGAKAANHRTIVLARFDKDQTDPAHEAALARGMLDQGADVIAASAPAALQEAEKSGMFSVGVPNDMASVAPKGLVTSIVFDWSAVLSPVVKQLASGTWSGGDMATPGIKEGVLDLTRPNLVPPMSLLGIATAREQMMAGTFSPFTGPIKAQGGALQLVDGQVMPMSELAHMHFLLDNVRGSLE